MSEDITWCYYTKCPNKKCEHHTSHITQFYVSRSYAFFKDCVWWDMEEKYFSTSYATCESEGTP
jgi:hypothetical protein